MSTFLTVDIDRGYTDLVYFNAIIFHERDLKPTDLPHVRPPDQLYIHFNLESPAYQSQGKTAITSVDKFTFFLDLSSFFEFFNLSMSYRLDADIRHGYGELVEVSPHPTGAVQLTETIMQYGLANTHLAVKENLNQENLICQFVSNCKTKSERNSFVQTIFHSIKNQKTFLNICGCNNYVFTK